MYRRNSILWTTVAMLVTGVAVAQNTENPAENAREKERGVFRAGVTLRASATYKARAEVSRKNVKELRDKGAPTPEVATASLDLANTLAQLLKQPEEAKPSTYAEARQTYSWVVEKGTPTQQLAARNNLAVVEISRGSYGEAIQQFQGGLKTAEALEDDGARSQYLLNYARTLEKVPQSSGTDSSQVASLYRQSFLADPSRTEAAIAGARFAWSRGQTASVSDFTTLLVSKGHLDSAEGLVRTALTNSPPAAAADMYPVLAALLDLLPAQSCSRKCFDERWRGSLSERRASYTGNSRVLADLILLAYADAEQIPSPKKHPGEVLSALGVGSWGEEKRRPISNYFSRVGALRAGDGDLPAAYGLYSAALAVDRENTDAALRKATVLIEKRAQLDPDGRQLNQFIDWLFNMKGGAYLGEDRPSILRLHTVLGTIFFQQKNWGNSYNPRSAIFQLEHAASTNKSLRDTKARQATYIPGVFEMLAGCYIAVEQPAKAYDAYLNATEEAVNQRNKERALGALSGLSTVSTYTPTETQQQRLASLQSSAQSLQ